MFVLVEMSSVARGISDFFNPRPSHGITGLLKNEGLHVPSVVTSVEGRDFHPDVVRLGLSQHRVLQSSPIAPYWLIYISAINFSVNFGYNDALPRRWHGNALE